MLVFNPAGAKQYTKEKGMKHVVLAEKANISEVSLCNILQGKRKCEAGEYVRICLGLGVEPGSFMTEK